MKNALKTSFVPNRTITDPKVLPKEYKARWQTKWLVEQVYFLYDKLYNS